MKLHLVRHGDAEITSKSGKDFDRLLSERGLKQTQGLGLYLKNKITNSEFWCSDAARTRETLASIANTCPIHRPMYLKSLYLCSKQDLLHHIWKRESSKDLLIVGHNFGISDLLSYFVDDSIEMQTAEYYCIDFKELASNETFQGTGIIADHFHLQV